MKDVIVVNIYIFFSYLNIRTIFYISKQSHDILVGVPRVELGLQGSKSCLLTITTTALADHTPILISLHQALPRMDKATQFHIPGNRNR